MCVSKLELRDEEEGKRTLQLKVILATSFRNRRRWMIFLARILN